MFYYEHPDIYVYPPAPSHFSLVNAFPTLRYQLGKPLGNSSGNPSVLSSAMHFGSDFCYLSRHQEHPSPYQYIHGPVF